MSTLRWIPIALVCVAAAFITSCGSPASNSGPAGNNSSDGSRSGGAAVQETPSDAGRMSATTACYAVEAGTKTVLRSQTFAIDFEPYKNSCFVTSHDPQYKDPPLESEFAIYKDGKKVFDFPDQFNGVTVGCWVEAVAFQDVNGDSLTDVVVVGKCSAKSAPYNENSVYINNGKTFFTREDANNQINEFKTIKDILGYIKGNPDAFSSNASASNRQS